MFSPYENLGNKINLGFCFASSMLLDDSKLIGNDFTRDQRRDFTIIKEILWESDVATDTEVNQYRRMGATK